MTSALENASTSPTTTITDTLPNVDTSQIAAKANPSVADDQGDPSAVSHATVIDGDKAAESEYQPLPEVLDIINVLKHLPLRNGTPMSGYEISALEKAIDMLRKGMPFEPEPLPDSGQGKWKDTARMMSEGNDYYRGIVQQVGEILGPDAYVSEDGSVQDSVLADKVPALVKALKEREDHFG